MSDITPMEGIEGGISSVSVVVVEPRGVLNVGAIARVMKNMGLSKLVLVNPQCDYLETAAQNMAVHAKDILTQAKVVNSLAEALAPCQRVIATTARTRTLRSPLETPRQALPWLLAPGIESALVFGREDSGLTNEELNQAHRFVRIPVHPGYTALNLAQAVAVCTYELFQVTLDPTPPQPNPPIESYDQPLASGATLEGYYRHLEKTLLQIEVLYPHTAAPRMTKLKRLYQRAELREDEVALLRGILGRVDWLVQQIPERAGHSPQSLEEL